MKVLFRVNASLEIGTGHLVRCLALAEALLQRGDEVHFETNAEINQPKIQIHRHSPEKQTFDWTIFDHYQLDHRHETPYRKFSKKIAAIDDFGCRVHDADLIIDSSISSQSGQRAAANPKTKFYAGADYLILRPEFQSAKQRANLDQSIENILVFFGGTDPQNLMEPYLNAIAKDLDLKQFQFHFLISGMHPHLPRLQSLSLPSHLHLKVSPSVSDLMLNCQFYLGAAGSVTWERMCLGLTGLVISIIDNQTDIAQTLDQEATHRYLGTSEQISPAAALKALKIELKNKDFWHQASIRAFNQVDGMGVQRIIELLLSSQGV